MPVIETQAGDVAAYIPTNVISITDGQIYLEPNLFNAGVRPAMNVGISVSRVGGNAQNKAMRKVAGPLKLDLAQFRELKAFSKFGSDLDKATQQSLTRGARLTEVMKQRQYEPIPVEKQIALIWTATKGYLDGYPLNAINKFEKEFFEYIELNHKDLLIDIVEKKELSDDINEGLKKATDDFVAHFNPLN